MDLQDMMYVALKAQAWEQAKGALRAVVALEGAKPARYDQRGQHISGEEHVRFKAAVEAFIETVEGEGFQE